MSVLPSPVHSLRSVSRLAAAVACAGLVLTLAPVATAAPQVGSSPVGASQEPSPVVPGTVTVAGKVQVGETLTVDPGEWSPSDVTLTCQWLRDEAPIDGATSRTYVLGPADAQRLMGVVVTGTAPDGSTNSNTYFTEYVEKGELPPAAAAPKVTGKRKLGATLALRYQPPSGARIGTVYWTRDGEKTLAEKGPETTYKPVKKDVGHTLYAVFLVTRTGYYSDRLVVKIGKISR